MSLGEKIFVGIPACTLLILVVDATSWWTWQMWLRYAFEFSSGYLLWTIWENRHALRNPHEHGG